MITDYLQSAFHASLGTHLSANFHRFLAHLPILQASQNCHGKLFRRQPFNMAAAPDLPSTAPPERLRKAGCYMKGFTSPNEPVANTFKAIS